MNVEENVGSKEKALAMTLVHSSPKTSVSYNKEKGVI
jgi:hypothetical protein